MPNTAALLKYSSQKVLIHFLDSGAGLRQYIALYSTESENVTGPGGNCLGYYFTATQYKYRDMMRSNKIKEKAQQESVREVDIIL